MGTKVLSPEALKASQSKFAKVLASSGQVPIGLISPLVNCQTRWVLAEHGQGIKRSKELKQLFQNWISLGCDPIAIPPLAKRHSLMGRLQDAMRFVVRTPRERRAPVINIFMTALRYHEIVGPYPEDIDRLWKPLREAISTTNEEHAILCGVLDGFSHSSHCLAVGQPRDSWINAYSAGVMVGNGISLLTRTIKGMNAGDYVSNDIPNKLRVHLKVNLDDAEILVKGSPHKLILEDGRKQRLLSILAEKLDIYPLSSALTGRSWTVSERGPVHRVLDRMQGMNLYDLVVEIAELIAGTQLSVGSPRMEIHGPCPAQFETNCGEIIPIQDKAGKLRPVATSTYTVNQVLTPIHRWLYQFLELIPADATLQERGIGFAKTSSATADFAKSTDLSSATDRFPRLIEAIALATALRLFCPEFSNGHEADAVTLAMDWYTLMGNTPYLTIDGDTITYGSGQAMGTRTSWAAFALAHHLVVFCAYFADKAKDPVGYLLPSQLKEFSQKYRLCGDDFFCLDRTIARNYSIIMEGFGVPVNEAKSYLSDGLSQTRIEFCKRLFVGGEQLSGVAPKVLVRAMSCQTIAPQAVDKLCELFHKSSVASSTLTLIANRYPKVLRSIPREYGGLGFVTHVSRVATLSEHGFLVLYHLMKIRAMSKFIPKNMFSVMDNPSDEFSRQLNLLDGIEIPVQHPDTGYHKYDDEWRYLANRPVYTDPKAQQDISYCLHGLTTFIDGTWKPDYSEWVEFVDTLIETESSYSLNLFLGTSSVEDDSFNHESTQSAKTALKVFKVVKRAKNACILDQLEALIAEDKDVFVSLVDYLDWAWLARAERQAPQ